MSAMPHMESASPGKPSAEFTQNVHAVLLDFLALPPELLNYFNQWQAVNPIPIPYSQIVGGPPV